MAIMGPRPRSLEKTAENRKTLRKDISKLQREILKIRFSKNFQLNEKDKERYNSWNKNVQEDKKESVIILKPYKNEKDYAIRKIEGNIYLYKHALTALICEEKGHVESVISMAGHGTYVECKRCGKHYKRPMNVEESHNWTKMMNTHFTI